MRVVIQSQARRATLAFTQVSENRIRLSVEYGSRRGETQLASWSEAEGIIIGFCRKLKGDETIQARPQEAVKKTA